MRKKPLIGIVLDSAENSEKLKYSSFPWYALRKNYFEAVSKAGGLPIGVAYTEDAEEISELIDGLLIPGGDSDVHPKFYGKELETDKSSFNEERTNFELALLKKILERDKPFFGICAGMQLFNVLLGGTLIQHIPDYIKSDIAHEQPPPKHIPSHSIEIKEGTLLFSIAGGQTSRVNSTHHQAVEKPGEGLIISAKAPDGIIEAVESDSHRFALGVEWHPEYLVSELDFNLFKKFVSSAKNG